MKDNIKRVIPKGLSAQINLNNLKPQPIFAWIKKQGVTDAEMLKTFNCGVGFCIIIKPKNFNLIKKSFGKNYQPYIIGKILTGKKNVKINGKINWQ